MVEQQASCQDYEAAGRNPAAPISSSALDAVCCPLSYCLERKKYNFPA